MYCLHRPTESLKMHAQVSCFHPLRLTFCFFCLFLLLLIDHFFSILKISSDAEFLSRRSKMSAYCFSVKTRQASTRKIVPYPFARYQSVHQNGYSSCYIKKKKKSFQVPSNLSRKPCEESNWTAQMHPRRWYTIQACSSISYIFIVPT